MLTQNIQEWMCYIQSIKVHRHIQHIHIYIYTYTVISPTMDSLCPWGWIFKVWVSSLKVLKARLRIHRCLSVWRCHLFSQDRSHSRRRSHSGHQQRESEGQAAQWSHTPAADGRRNRHTQDQETDRRWVANSRILRLSSTWKYIYIYDNRDSLFRPRWQN